MLKYYNYDIVCQEIPDEVTLAVNITGCPIHCSGCHSPWLWEDCGERLDTATITALIERYGRAVTCICFMGGDAEPQEVMRLAAHVKAQPYGLKTGWYSGRDTLPAETDLSMFDYLKTGHYSSELGGLKSSTTNQRLYAVADGKLRRIEIRRS